MSIGPAYVTLCSTEKRSMVIKLTLLTLYGSPLQKVISE